MIGHGITPGLFTFARLTTLFFSVLVALSSGSNYVVGAYLPQLGARLHLTHTQLNVFAVAGNVGVYLTGPFLGKIVDARGPRLLLIGAFISLLSGYSGIRGIYDAGLGEAAELSRVRFVLLVICSFITGLGGHAGMASAMNTTAKSFPDNFRAIPVGLVMSGFGLSAFFFSSISHILFPGNTSDFLLVLGLGTAIPMVFGFFFVRRIPLPSHGVEAAGSRDNYQPLATSADSDEFQHQDSSSTPLRIHSARESEEEAHEPIRRSHGSISSLPMLDSAVELFSSSDFDHRGRPVDVSRPNQDPANEKVMEGRGVDLYRWTLCKSVDFWIMCSIHSLLSGTGLMYINNVGAIAQALFAHNNPAYDEAESSTWQAAQVSSLSLANFCGRVVIGIAADTAMSRLRVPRSFCLPAVVILFILSQLVLMAIGDVVHLWMASVLVGIAYGCWYGLLPTISIEWFGLAHFSENWGIISIFPILGGNLFSIIFGRNLDAHETPAESRSVLSRAPTTVGPRPNQCLSGRECYSQTLYLNVLACMVALCLSVWAGRRDWLEWQARTDRMRTGEWEDEGEVVGSEDLDA